MITSLLFEWDHIYTMRGIPELLAVLPTVSEITFLSHWQRRVLDKKKNHVAEYIFISQNNKSPFVSHIFFSIDVALR